MSATERPPVSPPRKPNRPDLPGKVRIFYERASADRGRGFWHEACQKTQSGAHMGVVRHEKDYTVLECGWCGKRGRYPVGGSGVEVCDED